MKNIFIFLIIVFITNNFAQTANSYFPSEQGYVWHYKITPLDTLNNPVDSLVTFRVDSFATTSNYNNKSAKFVLTKNGNDPLLYQEPYLDTIFYSFEQNNGFEYLGMNQLDPIVELLSQFLQDTIGGVYNFFKSFEGWHSYYRFANSVNAQYTILQKDTTFTVDTLVLPLRFQILGKRFNDQTIQTEIGQFTCKKFTLERRLSYLITLPPPLPPLAVKIVGFIDSLWIAPQNWIVKTFLPSSNIDLNFIGLGSISIPGFKMDIHIPPLSINDSNISLYDFNLYQNFPNPFNPSTKIIWESPISGLQTLKVYDILGNEVATLVNEFREAGRYEVEFPKQGTSYYSSLPSGIYIYKIQIGDFYQAKKMLLIK